jgi:phage shock protein PspC (stress-responsive transcriptional regulator)
MWNKIKDNFQSFLELNVFGVCSWLGEKLGIKSSTIRLYFIYLSFFTFGSPIIIYLIFSFILEHKEYFKPRSLRQQQKRIWDL